MSICAIMLVGKFLGSEIAELKSMCIFHLERDSKTTVQRVYTLLYIWKLISKGLITRKNIVTVQWWMLTKLLVIIIFHYKVISNHYVVHLKLIQCYMSIKKHMLYVSIQKKKEHVSFKSSKKTILGCPFLTLPL